ncbi:MAG: guanylate kinase, partial [Gammaproteobacteria bacterium]|nr:guanylate kinase [Gammaproteobacteria bacterium]
HGVHYYFVTPQQFDEMVAADRFLEHAKVFGNSYGTSRAATENLLRQGKNIIFDIDWQGARAIKEKLSESVSVFILPPSRAALEDRLIKRGQDSPEVIARRMREAVSEMSHYKEFDHLVVNDDFDAALNDLKAIVRGEGAPRPVRVDMDALLSGA